MKAAICITCDRNYLEGLNTLLFSISFHMWQTPVTVVIISDDLDISDLHADPSMTVHIHRPDMVLYNQIPQEGRFPTIVHTIYESLRLGYDRVIWMGADQLVVGDLSPLLQADLPPLCAMQESTGTPSDNFCTGMLTISPKAFPGIFEEVFSLACQGQSYDSGDMGVMNEYVNRKNIEVTILDPWVDVSKRMFNHPGWWNKHRHQIKSIHYVGADKPWDNEPQGVLDIAHDPLLGLWWSYQQHTPIEVPAVI
jgi:lipopolysaccharide biosynthesis glycosyltransferase